MKKTTMLSYLDQQLTKVLSDYDIAIDWDTKNHTIEVIFRLFAENNEQAAIDDIDGTSSTEKIIEFEDGVLFYNSDKSQFNNEDFLATVPYEGKKGLRKSVANGFVAYLKDVLDEGKGALLDFLEDEQAAVFELNWSVTAFNSAVEQAVQKLDQDEYLPYPSY
jgi:hypothetical protein